MRVLGVDPGGARLGYGLVDNAAGYSLLASGIGGLLEPYKKGKTSFHAYRWRIIEHWLERFPKMLLQLSPDHILSERLPAGSSSGFINPQSEAAKVAVTVCQVIARQHGVSWEEQAANSLKLTLTGNGKATKVGVRNAVIGVFPQLEPRKKELTVVADESDAIGIALVGAGYRHDNRKD